MSNNFTPILLPQNTQEPKKKDTFLVVLMSLSAVLLAVLGIIVGLLFTGSYKGPMSAKANSMKTTDVTIPVKESTPSQSAPTPTVSFGKELDILEKELDALSVDTNATPTGLPVEPSIDTDIE